MVWKPQKPCAVPKVGVHYGSILRHCTSWLWPCFLVWHQLDTDVLMSVSHPSCTSPHGPGCLIWLGLTEGGHQGDTVSSPVITPGQPDGQCHVTAAKPEGWLHSCCSEMCGQLYFPWLAKGKWPVTERIGSLLTKSFRLIWKQKKLFTQMLLLFDVYLWCVGCRNFGQSMVDIQWHLSAAASPITSLPIKVSMPGNDPWLDPYRPVPSLEQVDYFPVCSTQISKPGWFPHSPEFVVSLLAYLRNTLNIVRTASRSAVE